MIAEAKAVVLLLVFHVIHSQVGNPAQDLSIAALSSYLFHSHIMIFQLVNVRNALLMTKLDVKFDCWTNFA